MTPTNAMPRRLVHDWPRWLAVFTLAASTGFAVAPTESHAAFAGENGRIVFAATQPSGDPDERDIYTMEPDGSAKVQLTNDPSTDDIAPAVSADGTQIVFQRLEASGLGFWDLYVMNADGSALRNVTSTPSASETLPVFSPDGTQLAFRKRHAPGSDTDIWTMNLNGTNLRNVSNDPAAADHFPSWSPDGQLIAFTKQRNRSRTGTAIFVIRPDGTHVSQLTPWGTFAYSDWSPDGKSILILDELLCDSCGESDVFVMRSDGKRIRQLTDTSLNEIRAVWSPEGDAIVFQAACVDFDNPACFYFDVYTMDRKGRSVANVTSTPDIGEGGAYWAAAPAG